MYAVIDLETTGTRTSRHDRVVEIGVVRLDRHGRAVDEWSSLVNPDRDLGPQHIHGISAAEARRAPSFADLAGDLADRLRGHTLVAHNLTFDSMFLAAEFGRLGFEVPVSADRGPCGTSPTPRRTPWSRRPTCWGSPGSTSRFCTGSTWPGWPRSLSRTTC